MKNIYDELSTKIQKLIFNSIEEGFNEESELIDYVLNNNLYINYIDVVSELNYLCKTERLEKEYGESITYLESEK